VAGQLAASARASGPSGEPLVQPRSTHARVYRLMTKHEFVLERRTDADARAAPRQAAAIRSNCRWCSDALEFACRNGEVVRAI